MWRRVWDTRSADARDLVRANGAPPVYCRFIQSWSCVLYNAFGLLVGVIHRDGLRVIHSRERCPAWVPIEGS